MKKAAVIFSLTVGSMFTYAHCMEDPSLPNKEITQAPKVKAPAEEKALVETIEALIPLVKANIDFAENFINSIRDLRIDATDIKTEETAALVSQFLSRGNRIGNHLNDSLRSNARFLYEQYASDKLANQYFLGALSDVRWALKEAGAGLNHFRIQQALSQLLHDVADINRATCNDLAHMLYLGIDGLGLDLLQVLGRDTTERPKRIHVASHLISKHIQAQQDFGIMQQYSMLMFYLEFENKLSKFCLSLPDRFDRLVINNGFCDSICQLIGKSSAVVASIIGDAKKNINLTDKQKYAQQQKLNSYNTTQPLRNEFLSDAATRRFLQSKLQLQTNLFLKKGQEFLPPHMISGLIEKEKSKLRKFKQKELHQGQKNRQGRKTDHLARSRKDGKVGPRIPYKDQLSNFLPPAKEGIAQFILPPQEELLIIPTPAIIDKKEREEKAEESTKSGATLGDVQIETAAHLDHAPPTETEQWDYWTWHHQQDLAKESPSDEQNASADIEEFSPLTDTLTKGALRFYEAVFGLGGHNVTRSDFNEFLKQVGGQKLKQTHQGLKIVALDDTSVLCTYAVPDLSDNGKTRIFKVHQPHGNEPFLMKTLKSFFEPQLNSVGYNPRQPKIAPFPSTQMTAPPTKVNCTKAGASQGDNCNSKNARNKKKK